MNTNTTQDANTYRFLAEDIANLFYRKDINDRQEWSRGSLNYWNHVHNIEDMVTQFVQNNGLTLDNDR